MHVLRFEVTGLLGRDSVVSADLHKDVNILTGRNGSGKTSLLKLLWYVISGNIFLALKEIVFSKLYISTSEYECTLFRESSNTCRIEFKIGENSWVFSDIVDDDGDVVVDAEDQANSRLQTIGSSVFLPTFRRIEGGFSIGVSSPIYSSNLSRVARSRSEVEESLQTLSQRLTKNSHIFVAAISTVDVVSLLLRQYSDLSTQNADLQQREQLQIIRSIKDFKADWQESGQIQAATELLDSIRARIEDMEVKREEFMAPFNVVRELVATLFKHSGIKIGNRINFGDAANAVNSDALSAGEKQMLSFICYNAFHANSVFFIDEPELSLHVDWQRQLFPMLQKQQSTNQFIIATHSPFIYSKYPDKEITIDEDRGDSGRT